MPPAPTDSRTTFPRRPGRKKIILLAIAGMLLFANLVDGIVDAVDSGKWQGIAGQLLILAVVAYLVYRSRERLDHLRQEYRERFESRHETIGVRDAALFSLTWSVEIYRGIPEDRRKLVKQSFILIGLAFLFLLIQFGPGNLLALAVCLILVLAGVNLLVWVVATERSQKEILSVELETAREMQMSLMPKSDPDIAGYDIAGFCAPAREVGGDIFDYIRIDGEASPLGIAVADVAGKGMDAAMTAVYTSGALTSEAHHVAEPEFLMRNLNATICTRQNRHKFVSLLFAALYPAERRLSLVNAGQQKPLLLRGDEAAALDSEGPRLPLGLMTGTEYARTDLSLQPGDALLFYTDGFTEAMNAAREPYGIERLSEAFKRARGMYGDSRTSRSMLQQEIFRFTAGAEQSDDMTGVVLRVMGGTGG